MKALVEFLEDDIWIYIFTFLGFVQADPILFLVGIYLLTDRLSPVKT